MYVVTPYPNVLYAFDLTREGYPLKWKYRPAVDPNAVGIACCDVINRGAFYAEGRIVYNLLDGHTVAIDRKSTRLNSSHLVISYAVFCLKKKKWSINRKNKAAARDSLAFVRDVDIVGLGSGSTAEDAVRLLGGRGQRGLKISGLPS